MDIVTVTVGDINVGTIRWISIYSVEFIARRRKDTQEDNMANIDSVRLFYNDPFIIFKSVLGGYMCYALRQGASFFCADIDLRDLTQRFPQ